jgi:23S rRNA (cytosine1962-C5)-methyltransferase
MQAHSAGMYLHREDIAAALKKVLGEKLLAVYDKSAETLPKPAELDAQNGYIFGNTGLTEVIENGNKFIVDWEHGQKTGFFVDQRENRELLARYCKDKVVANTFCYTGGFSVYAMKAGAKEVHSVDSSKKAIDLTDKNVELNFPGAKDHRSFPIDTFEFFKDKDDVYDVIVLDPPAFAKHRDAKHNAVKGYKRLNAEALRKIKPGGVLFTFSCSQVVDRYLFNSTVLAAAITVGRNVRVMHQLSQPPDHPINIYNPEGEYLKGLVLYVE